MRQKLADMDLKISLTNKSAKGLVKLTFSIANILCKNI